MTNLGVGGSDRKRKVDGVWGGRTRRLRGWTRDGGKAEEGARGCMGAYRKLARIAVRVDEGLEDVVPGAAFDEVAEERGEQG